MKNKIYFLLMCLSSTMLTAQSSIQQKTQVIASIWSEFENCNKWQPNRAIKTIFKDVKAANVVNTTGKTPICTLQPFFRETFNVPKGQDLILEQDMFVLSENDVHIDGNIIGKPITDNHSGQNLVIQSLGTIIINGDIELSDGGQGINLVTNNILAFNNQGIPKSIGNSFHQSNKSLFAQDLSGGEGGSLVLLAKRIIINGNIKIGHGGNGYNSGQGGDGGSFYLMSQIPAGSFVKQLDLYAGNGGLGGNGSIKNFNSGNGGNGGDAIFFNCTGADGSDVLINENSNGSNGGDAEDGICITASGRGTGGHGGGGGSPLDQICTTMAPKSGWNGGNGGKGGNAQGGNGTNSSIPGGQAYGGQGGGGGSSGNSCNCGNAGIAGSGGKGGDAIGGHGATVIPGRGGDGGFAFSGNGGRGGQGGLFRGNGGNAGNAGNATSGNGGDGSISAGTGGEARLGVGGLGGSGRCNTSCEGTLPVICGDNGSNGLVGVATTGINGSISVCGLEICDGLDNNCDGQIDEGVKTTFYRDADGDGYGNPLVTTQACVGPTGYVANNLDCKDDNPNVKPGTSEICGNNLDDNCNGQVDENCSCNLSVTLPICKTFYLGYATSMTLTPNVVSNSTSLTYKWSNGKTTQSINVTPSVTTVYTVTVTAGVGCTKSASVSVEVKDVRCGSKKDKVQVCHEPSTKKEYLCVSKAEAAIHLAHEDKLGTCGLVVCEPYQPSAANLAINTNEYSNPMLEVKKDALLIYPNPTNQDVTIEYNLEKITDVTLSLTDVNGRSLWNKVVKNVLEGSETIDINHMPSGVYFVKILPVGEQAQVQRLVISKQ